MIVGELLMERFQLAARVISVLEANILKHHQKTGKRRKIVSVVSSQR
jgi:hypothetical protein